MKVRGAEMKIDKIRTLYHGTAEYHKEIDLNHSNRFKDFGRGYYVTSHRQQAFDWAKNKGKRRGECWVFEYALSPVPEDMKIKELLRYDADWLEFVTKRRVWGEETPFDIVYDRMADNKGNVLVRVLQEYAYGYLAAQRALDIIRFYQDDKDQYCFKTPAAVRLLTRTRTYRFGDGKWKEEFL